MTAPRVEKLRQFIQDLDALHREFADETALLDAVALRLAALVKKMTGCRKSTPCRIPITISSTCCMLTPDSVSPSSASSGDRGNRRRFTTIVCGAPSACCAARRRISATAWTSAACRWLAALPNASPRRSGKSLFPRRRYSPGEQRLADRVSISIHVYGGNIGGVRRAVYTPEGLVKPFVSGYSNRHLPNIWDLSKDN